MAYNLTFTCSLSHRSYCWVRWIDTLCGKRCCYRNYCYPVF